MELISILKQFGFNDKEAAIYLACLELGPAMAQKIAKKANIKRTTVYLVAESLKKQGLMAEFRDKQGIHYVAEPPEHLIKSLDKRKEVLKQALPQLQALANKEIIKPIIRFYESKAGILEICEDTLKTKDSETLFISSLSDIYRIISKKYDDEYYIPTRKKQNIRFRALILKDPRSLEFTKYDQENLRETRFLPQNFPFTATQFIYQNKVAYLSSYQELMGIIIESADISQMERQKFAMLWNFMTPL
jgi:sugar-specific transcriptional regulator TrmB